MKGTQTAVGRDSQRGAAAVEFALVASLLFLLVFAIIEVSLLFRSRISISNAAEEAARRGAIAGNAPDADYEILQQVSRRSSDGNRSIERVVIFHASDPLDEPHSACTTGAPASNSTHECNVYDAADLKLGAGAFGSCAAGLDGGWCPTTRNARPGTSDLLGIWIRGVHHSPTGVMPDKTFTARVVIPIEPSSRG